MGCCQIEKFCCCCSLKTGTLVIATLGWITTLTQIFGLTAAAVSVKRIDGMGGGSIETPLGQQIGGAVVSFIMCALLVYGVYKKNHYYFLPWLILQCIGCIGLSILSAIVFFLIFVAVRDLQIFLIIIFLVILIATILYWYFWICVFSHYSELKREKSTGPASNVCYIQTSNNPPHYDKERQQLA